MPRIDKAVRGLLLEEKAARKGDYPVPVPSRVLNQYGLSPVAVDTETNGLYADDGVRTAIVSVAWVDPAVLADEDALTRAIETGEGVLSYAFPFDQGRRDKFGTATELGQLFETSEIEGDYNLPEREWHFLYGWLAGQGTGLIYHNAKFDLEKLRVGTRHWPGQELMDQTLWDSQLTNKEIWPTESTSLKPTAARLWGESEAEEAAALKPYLGPKTDPRYDLVPWNVIGPYAAKDAELTVRLYWHQQRMIEEGAARPEWVRRELEFMKCLYLMEKRGMPFDAASSLDACARIEEYKQQVAARLPFVPSINAAKRYYFDDPPSKGGLGLTPFATTPGGKSQLNDDVIVQMEKVGVPHIEDYALWRRLDVAQSMWYRGYAEMVGDDGRLRTCFRQTFVKTGRISVERFQAQALPHAGKLKLIPDDVPRVRELFFRGHEAREVDLAQAELRVAAKKADCRTMLEMIEAGDDLHGITTTELFGTRPGDPDWFDTRQVGKRANFSFIFRVGAETFQETVRKLLGIDMDLRECEQIVKKWNALYPEFRRIGYQYEEIAKRTRYVVLANGKKAWFEPYETYMRPAFNKYVQGSLAELNKDWVLDTERRHPGTLLMSVHDSQYLDSEGWTPEAADRVAADVAARGGELGTEMFDVPMEADWGPWHA